MQNKNLFTKQAVYRVMPWLCLVIAVIAGYWGVLSLWPAWEACWLLPEGPGAWFPDMYAVLAASDLHAAGFNPYGDNPLGTQHFYPRSWFGLYYLGFTRADAHGLGLMLGGFFLAVSLVWLRPSRYGAAFFAGLCLLAPPLTLGFQRANVDNLLYVMLVGVAFLLTSRQALIRIGVGGLVVMAATLLKFYPIFGAGTLWWNESERRRWWVILMFLMLLIIFGTSLWEDYQRITSIVNVGRMGGHLYSFGANFAPVLQGVLVSGVIACAGGAWVGWKHVAPRLKVCACEAEPVGFLLGGCVLMGCFIIGNSFAYRLVFVLLMIPWWWRLRESTERLVRVVALVSMAATLMLLWRDGMLAVILRELQQTGRADLHRFAVAWHQQMLAVVQWVWCALVVCLMAAMARRIPVAKEPVSDTK